MDKTSEKIINAAMELILECGYAAATTKDIAERAGVNECTLFRKFGGKKEIVVEGMKLPRWHPNVTEETFAGVIWELRSDLAMFMERYMREVTPEFVRLSIGLRAPQIYEDTAPLIMNIPRAFRSVLVKYLTEMRSREKIKCSDISAAADMILSASFGYVFLSASFGSGLVCGRKEYIASAVEAIAGGMET